MLSNSPSTSRQFNPWLLTMVTSLFGHQAEPQLAGCVSEVSLPEPVQYLLSWENSASVTESVSYCARISAQQLLPSIGTDQELLPEDMLATALLDGLFYEILTASELVN